MMSLNSVVSAVVGIFVGALGVAGLIGINKCREIRLDAGWAGILGAVIGVLGTLFTNYLTHNLQNSEATKRAKKRRDRLRSLLEDSRFEWRTIETLSVSIAADEKATTELLFEIDARADQKNPKQWALISKKPFPK